MNKKRILFAIALLTILIFIAGAWHFVSGVNHKLWMNSIRTITESTHQGANALRIQLETDFKSLDSVWKNVSNSKSPESIPDLYKEVLPDVTLYLCGRKNCAKNADQAVFSYLKEHSPHKGILDSHINSVTGENVFNIFIRGILLDGTPAYLVKEYRTKTIADQFTLSFYDNTGFSYLVNRNGDIMVRPLHKNSNKTVSNMFDMISETENDGQMKALFQDSLFRHKTGWAKFTYDNTGMVFCYEPLQAGSNWLLVSIVPEGIIMEQAVSIVRKTLFFSGIAAATILVVVLVFYGMKMHENKLHTNALAAALNAADQANQAKSNFLMDMSHDIRTPLNAIMGMTKLARENLLDQKQLTNCLSKIHAASAYLFSLISDLLDMSQIEHGKVILKEDAVRLESLFQETADIMKDNAKEGDVTLTVLPVRLKNEVVTGDLLRIRQILLNIIKNAVKYTPPGGTVSLELTQESDTPDGYGTYRFRCADTGIGMDEEFLQRLFLPFERARNTTASKIFGTGVGLAITKSLLDMMNGKISVESEPGKGSVFTVEFYFRYQEHDGLTALELSEPDKEQTKDEGYADKRILLVEDNEINMEILEAMLEMTGVQTEKATDGQEAVKMVHDHPDGYYDLIFMDIQMPVMDGYEATRQIRRMDKSCASSLPIFAVSANALASDIQNSMEAGMNGHIAKPVDFDLIEKVLKQCFA